MGQPKAGKKLEISNARHAGVLVAALVPSNLVADIDKVCDRTLTSRAAWLRDAILMRLRSEGRIADEAEIAAA